MTCAEPGCGGTVVDGYCDVCGTAPAAAAQEPAAATGAQEPPATARSGSPGRALCADGPHRLVEVHQLPRPARRGDRRHPARSEGRSGRRDHDRSAGAGGQPVLRQPRLQQARRAWTGRPARTRRGLLHPVRHAILLRSQAFPRRPRRRPVRGAGLHRARRTRLDLPGDRPQRAQPLGGAQGPAELQRRRRDGRRRRRGHHALARSSTRTSCRIYNFVEHPDEGGVPGRLHRHGVRGRHVAQADPQGARRSAPAGPGRRLHRRDRARAGLPARAGARVLRLQAGQRDADRRAAQAHRPRRGHRHGRRGERDLRDRRLPGARDRQDRPHRRQRRLHGRPDARRSRDGRSAGEAATSSSSCPARRPCRCSRKYESLYRAILRATDPDPERRFSSMEEMADQLTGVLHEIAAADTGTSRSRGCRTTSARSARSTARAGTRRWTPGT